MSEKSLIERIRREALRRMTARELAEELARLRSLAEAQAKKGARWWSCPQCRTKQPFLDNEDGQRTEDGDAT